MAICLAACVLSLRTQILYLTTTTGGLACCASRSHLTEHRPSHPRVEESTMPPLRLIMTSTAAAAAITREGHWTAAAGGAGVGAPLPFALRAIGAGRRRAHGVGRQACRSAASAAAFRSQPCAATSSTTTSNLLLSSVPCAARPVPRFASTPRRIHTSLPAPAAAPAAADSMPVDSIYALSSAPGKAGVSVLRISGPAAHTAALRLMRPSGMSLYYLG